MRLRTLFLLTLALPPALSEVALAAGGVTGQCEAMLASKRLLNVVPATAGGGKDTVMRIIASQMEKRFGFSSVSIVNMPGGRDIPAMFAVADPGGDALTLGLFNPMDVVLPNGDDTARPAIADLPAIATVINEPQVWIAKAGFTLDKISSGTIVLGSSRLNSVAAHDFLFPVEVLGAKPEIIASYDGSTELLAALLRSEVDVVNLRLSTGVKSMKGGDHTVALTLTDGPVAELPGVAWLAGPGGLAEQAAAGADDARQARIAKLVNAVLALSPQRGTIHTSGKTDAATRACLASALDAVLQSEEFKAEAKALKQTVAPAGQAETEVMIAATIAAHGEAAGDIANALAPFLAKQ